MGSKSKRRSTSRSAKRERFAQETEKAPSGASPLVLLGGLLVVVVILVGVVWAMRRPTAAASAAPVASAPASAAAQPVRAATSGHAAYPQAVAEDGVVRFAAATFDDGQAHYYTYMHNNDPIEFFVLKSQDGVIRAAFNACDVCYLSLKGYTQDGDEMVCNNCGRRFPSEQINVLKGGCNPAPLERTLEGDALVIRVEDIVSGGTYF
jgi:uncharacterized membrane protein